MAHVSVVKKLERCHERIGSARQGEANLLHSDNYQLIKYKIRIKDYNLTATNPPACKLLHFTSKPPSSPSLRLISLQNDNEVQQINVPCPPLKLPHCSTVKENGDESCASWPPWKLQDSAAEQDGKVNCAPWYVQEQTVNDREKSLCSPYEPQKAAKAEKQQQVNEEVERERGLSPWKLQNEVQEKRPARGFWEAVKKIECECCGMEEECTRGYEEKVRAQLRGHWLCGLCEQAVGEEKKRVGGSVQAALVAHMQPCRRFARSRVSTPPAEVAVPRAVCRLLSRHLSTPARHHPMSPGASTALTRSSSCIPSLPKS